LAFRINDPPFVVAEVAHAYGQHGQGGENPNREGSSPPNVISQASTAELPEAVKIASWPHTGSFADENLNTQRKPLSVAGGSPLERVGNIAIYGVINQMVWRPEDDSDRGLSFSCAQVQRRVTGT
jgi:hypothetical protein